MSTITTAFVYNAPNAAYDFPLSAPYNFDTYNAGMFEGYLPTSNYAGTGMGYCPQQMGVWVQRRAAAMIEDSFRTNWRVESRKSAPDLKVAPPAVAAGVLPVATAAEVKPTTTAKIPATSVARSIARQDKAVQQLFAIAKSRYEQLAKCSGPIPAHVTGLPPPLGDTIQAQYGVSQTTCGDSQALNPQARPNGPSSHGLSCTEPEESEEGNVPLPGG
ncbi:hypothetical protein FRB90_005262, partial [Tulasnella sp. 427]